MDSVLWIGLRGLILGFAIAAPVGPIGVLCIRQTLTYGWLSGLVSGLGAATADAIYGSIAGFGLTAIAGLLVNQQTPLQLIGGSFLCYLGLRTLRHAQTTHATLSDSPGSPSPLPLHRSPAPSISLATHYATTLLLTLTNPATILSFTAIFASLGIAALPTLHLAVVLIIGVFCGSALWWLLLSSGTALLRSRLTATHLKWVNRLSGLMITSFGGFAIAFAFR
ncbi:MAG: LysE family translocator [Thainema sp.]